MPPLSWQELAAKTKELSLGYPENLQILPNLVDQAELFFLNCQECVENFNIDFKIEEVVGIAKQMFASLESCNSEVKKWTQNVQGRLNHLASIENSIRQAEEASRLAESKLQEKRDQLKEAEKSLEVTNGQRAESQQEYDDLQAKNRTAQETLDERLRQTGELDDELANVSATVTRLSEEAERFEAQERQLARDQEKLCLDQVSVTLGQNQLDDRQRDLVSARQSNDDWLRSYVQKAKSKSRTLQYECQELRSHVTFMANAKAMLNINELRRVNGMYENFEKERMFWKDRCGHLKEDLEELSSGYDQLREQNARHGELNLRS